MDQTQPDISLDDSIKQVMQTLPPVIRDYIVSGKYTAVVKMLMAKYSLRIDQAGVLERELMLLLMGIESPDEFVQALAGDALLDQATVDSIVREVNELIFIPLRAEEEGRGRRENALPTAPTALPEVARPVVKKPEEVVRLVLPEISAAPQLTLPTVPNTPREATPMPGLVGESRLHKVKNLLEGYKELAPAQTGALESAPTPVTAPSTPVAPAPSMPKPNLTIPTPSAPITSYTNDPYREPVDEPKV